MTACGCGWQAASEQAEAAEERAARLQQEVAALRKEQPHAVQASMPSEPGTQQPATPEQVA